MEENTKRIYGVEEKSVGKGKVEAMVVGTVSELGIFLCCWQFCNLKIKGKGHVFKILMIQRKKQREVKAL